MLLAVACHPTPAATPAPAVTPASVSRDVELPDAQLVLAQAVEAAGGAAAHESLHSYYLESRMDLPQQGLRGDTKLWWVQLWTGFALFFLGTVHLYGMLTQPELIGPFESADRIWTGRMWPLYLVLLFAVEIHGSVGLYRLALKWGWFEGRNPDASRRRLRVAKTCFSLFFLTLGLVTLLAYMRLGAAHADRAGERYVPAVVVGNLATEN